MNKTVSIAIGASKGSSHVSHNKANNSSVSRKQAISMNNTFTVSKLPAHGTSKATTTRQSSVSQKRITLTRPKGNDMPDKVKVLVDERKKNKMKISDLEE